MELTAPRRSQLLQQLLQQQVQPQPNIRSGGELLAKLLAQGVRQAQINSLRKEEAQAESDSNRRIADVLAGQQGRQLLDLQNIEGGVDTISVPQKRGAEGLQRQHTLESALNPQEMQAYQTLRQSQRALADPTEFQQRQILQDDAQEHERDLQATKIESAEDQLKRQIAAEERMLGRKLDADELAQVRDIQSKFALQAREIEAAQRELAASGVKMTDTQRVSAGYAARMDQANAILDDVGDKHNFWGVSHVAAVLPNAWKTEDRQTFEQAKRNFINAVLRRESGAVISDQEFDNANMQYFPVPGDDPKVLQQKLENRRIATEAMRLAGGAAYEELTKRLGGSQPGGSQPGASVPGTPVEGTIIENEAGQRQQLRNGQWVEIE